MMLNYKHKKSQIPKGNRFLICVSVLGSAGPIRFVVNEKDTVAAVIDTTLKAYAREGRLPVLGSNLNDFILYCPSAFENGALTPWQTIGSAGVRNFMLCKKPQTENTIDGVKSPIMARKGVGSWKSWFNKSLSLKISSH